MNEPTDPESGTIGRVRSWLRESGYPLEMRTAASFQAHGFATEAARHYVADDDATLREIDVVATGFRPTGPNNGWLEIVFVVECKASKAHPWVAFLGDNRLSRDDDVLAVMRVDSFGPQELDPSTGRLRGRPNRSMLQNLHHAPMLYTTDRWAYAVTETAEGSSQAYKAIRQVTSAVTGYARDAVEQVDRPVLRVTIPIVVTSAPLVTCRLDEQGSEQLAEIEQVLLVTRLRPTAELAGVWIVQEAHLDEFARLARAGLERLHLGMPRPS